MQKGIALPEVTIQHEVDVCVHKHERQYQNVVLQCRGIHPVHSVPEIVNVIEHCIYRLSIRIEMPAVVNGNGLSFNVKPVKAKVGRDFCPEFVTVQHNHFNRL